jgi:hypothetical protein
VSESGAGGDDTAAPSKKSGGDEEVVGVEVPTPANSPATDDAQATGARPPSINDDDADGKKSGGKAEKPSNFTTFIRATLQPVRLLTLAVNGFLILFAAQLFNEGRPQSKGRMLNPYTSTLNRRPRRPGP